MAERYRSGALAAAHETARGLTEAGAMAKRTMKAFDEMCLTPVAEMTPEKIRALRMTRTSATGSTALSMTSIAATSSSASGRSPNTRDEYRRTSL